MSIVVNPNPDVRVGRSAELKNNWKVVAVDRGDYVDLDETYRFAAGVHEQGFLHPVVYVKVGAEVVEANRDKIRDVESKAAEGGGLPTGREQKDLERPNVTVHQFKILLPCQDAAVEETRKALLLKINKCAILWSRIPEELLGVNGEQEVGGPERREYTLTFEKDTDVWKLFKYWGLLPAGQQQEKRSKVVIVLGGRPFKQPAVTLNDGGAVRMVGLCPGAREIVAYIPARGVKTGGGGRESEESTRTEGGGVEGGKRRRRRK